VVDEERDDIRVTRKRRFFERLGVVPAAAVVDISAGLDEQLGRTRLAEIGGDLQGRAAAEEHVFVGGSFIDDRAVAGQQFFASAPDRPWRRRRSCRARKRLWTREIESGLA